MMILALFLGITLIISMVAFIIVEVINYDNQLKDFHPVYLGKLYDADEQDIIEVKKYLELTNSIKNRGL